MTTASSDIVQRINSSVCGALTQGAPVVSHLHEQVGSGVNSDVVCLGALFGLLEHFKGLLKNARGGKLAQTEMFAVVDHWGRLTALSTLIDEIARHAESDRDAAGAQRETLWRGISECALNLGRDIGAIHGLKGCAEAIDWVVTAARAESAPVAGSIKRMVARG